MTIIRTEQRSPAFKMLMDFYRSRPDLIAHLLVSLGSQQVRDLGSEVRGTCPLHNGGGQANFVIWYDNDVPVWKCYSRACGRGPLHTLVLRRYQLRNDAEALQWLAQMAGLQIDTTQVAIPPEVMEQSELRAFELRMGAITRDLPNFFPEYMVSESTRGGCHFYENNPDPKKRYPRELLRQFEIGFVPANTWVWRSPDRPDQMSGWFDERVSIPIRMMDARLIGFSGRRLDAQKFQKYKILPGTKKRHALYGLHLPQTREAIRRTKMVHVVEGFPDTWRFHQFGVFNVTSFIGTDPSTTQIEALGSLPLERIVFAYDSDEGGRTAVQNYAQAVEDLAKLEALWAPESLDPGDLYDRDRFMAYLANPQPLYVRS